MFDELLRPLKDSVLSPLTAAVGRRMHPNTITLIAFLFGAASAVMAAMGWYMVGLIFWIGNRIFDGLDGAVARAFDSQSDLGGYLDILLDFTVYAAVPAAFALSLDVRSAYLALILLLSVFYINGASWMYLSALLEKRKYGGGAADGELSPRGATAGLNAPVARSGRSELNEPDSRRQTSIRMPGGLIGGTETIIFYTLFFLLPGRIVLLFAAMALLTAVTIVQRLTWAVHHLGKESENDGRIP
ncbi:MAG: CDP-alcohol phosphatidyltransferase family protein [Sediminispirochaetaceae bacterium]